MTRRLALPPWAGEPPDDGPWRIRRAGPVELFDWQRGIGGNTVAPGTHVFGIQLQPDEPATEPVGDEAGGCGAGEDVQDDTRHRVCGLTRAGKPASATGVYPAIAIEALESNAARPRASNF